MHKRRFLLACALSVALALATGGLYAFGMSYYERDYSWFDGSGSYVLEDAGQLEALARLVNGTWQEDEAATDASLGIPASQRAELEASDGKAHSFEDETITLRYDLHYTARNIYYARSVSPIGTAEHPFQGTFDGGNRPINRLLLSNADSEAPAPTSYVGLFGHVGQSGTVKNVVVKDTCAVRLSVASDTTPIRYVGSVVGWCEGSIENCSSAADMQLVWDDGNAGQKRPAELASVINGVGGIAGYCDGDISGCEYKGHLEITTPADAYHVVQDDTHMVNVVKYVGGIVGRSGGAPERAGVKGRAYGDVSNCTSSANLNIVTSGAGGRDRFDEVVDSKSQYVGGIAGYAIGDVTDCTNSGNIAATSYVVDFDKSDEDNENGLDQADGGGDSVGGIVGGYRSEGYSTIWPTEAEEQRAKNYFRDGGIGVDSGIMGSLDGAPDHIFVQGCTNLGQVEACSNVGGIAGSAGTYTNITSCVNGDAKKALADTSYAKVFSTRWNKPCTGGIAGRAYGRISYCRNHGQVANTKIGYYVGGIVGDLYFHRDANNAKYDTPELWACYNTGICASGMLRRGTIAGGNGGYIHDCLYLYGLTGGEDEEERTQVAVGYEAPGDAAVQKNLKVAYASDVAAANAIAAGDEEAISLKSAEAVAWLNANAQREGWKHYWMLASNANRGYPVLKEEGYDSVAQMDVSTLSPAATLVRNAVYTTSMNPVPQVKLTVTVAGTTRQLVQNADFYIVPDKAALGLDGVCKGVTTGKPYTATVQGIGNYTGACCEVAYGIDKGDFSECGIYALPKRYTGAAQNPESIVVFDAGGRAVDEDAYTFSVNGGEDCIDPGTYAVTATAKGDGNYRGSCTGKYVINKIDIARDCDVVGVTYTEPKKPGQAGDSTPRVWFWDDVASKLYEVNPILDEGKLTYYTLEELAELRESGGWWNVSDTLLESYVGYPKVEGFNVQMWGNEMGLVPYTSATAKEYDENGAPVYGMSADYIATDIKPKVIGVNYELGKLDDGWWKTIYGGGSSGATGGAGDIAGEGTRNIESSAKGSITVAYRTPMNANEFTKNYDVLTFGINPVEVEPTDLDITQTTTVVKYNEGQKPEDLPTVKMKYLGNVVDPVNYSFEFDHVIDVNGNVRSAKNATYNIGDALYYRMHFRDGASIQCEDIDIHVTIIEDQKPIDDASVKVEFDPSWRNVYTFAGITNPAVTVIDEDTGLKLREGIDYELTYNSYTQRASLVPAPGKITQNNSPAVSIRGMDGYIGYRVECYDVEKTVLHAADIERIGKGDMPGIALRNRNTYLNTTISESGPYFMYRVQGYDKDYLSQNLGLAWELGPEANARSSHTVETDAFSNGMSFHDEHLFEVRRIQDSLGNEVARAIEPGAYKIEVTGTVVGNLGFQFPADERAWLPLYIEPLHMERDTFTGFDGEQHRIPSNSVSVWNLAHGNDPSWALGDTDEVVYTGNPVQPHSLITDGYFNTHKDDLMKDAREGGTEWKKHVLPRSDYRIVTQGFEAAGGPVEPGTYYLRTAVAAEDSMHLVGTHIFPGESEPGSWREYRVVAAPLDVFSVATADSDTSEGMWIKVGEAFYGDEGAEPAVTFWVDGEQCTYVEDEDYRLDYRDNTQVGTGTVRITVLDEGHLTAAERDDDANPYVEVPFEILGDKVNLADTGAVRWTLPNELAIADVAAGTLVDVPATAQYENSLGHMVTVPADAYELVCGTFNEEEGVFTRKDAGWNNGDVVYFQVIASGKYEQFTAMPVGGAAEGEGAVAAPASAGSPGLVAASAPTLVGHTVVGSASVTAGSSFATANQEGEPITVSLEKVVLPYTGAEDVPRIAVADGEAALVEGRDYVVERSKGAGVGQASVTVRGIGGYTGSCVLPFTVEPTAISSGDVSVLVDPMTYTGSTLRPPSDSIHVRIGDVELPRNDYEVRYDEHSVNAGTAAGSLVLEAASNNLTGSVEVPFDILGKPLKAEDFSVSVADKAFTGGNVVLTAEDVKVIDKKLNRELAWGSDFTVGYAGDHRSVGEAAIIVSGRGNYAGTMEASFNIAGSDLSGAKVEVIGGAFPYTGAAVKPDLKVTLNGQELSLGDDYTAEYRDNVSAGTATVTVSGEGNCTGKTQATFKIEQNDVSRCTVYQKSQDYAYTGRGVAPQVVLRLNGTRIPASQYTMSYFGADGKPLDGAPVEIGSYTVSIEGRDNLEGATFAPFDIVQAPIGECKITLRGDWYDFGAQVKPTVSVETPAGVAIGADEFTVTYGPGTDLGAKSWVNVEAAGGHVMGTTYVPFTIGRIPISAADVKFEGGGTYEYTGKEIRPAVSIVIGERVLKRGTDFNVSYLGDCTSVGTQPVEITCPATSVFTSDATARYTIVEHEDEEQKPAAPATPVAPGTATTPATPAAPGTATTPATPGKQPASSSSSASAGSGKAPGSPSQAPAVAAPKAKQPMKASGKTVTVKFKKLKKKAQKVKRSKAMRVSKAQGTLSFKKLSGSKKITVNAKTGKITVKKRLKKGTYKVKVRITASGNAKYQPGFKVVKFKLRVK